MTDMIEVDEQGREIARGRIGDNDKKCGQWEFWDHELNIHIVCHYNSDGKLHGSWTCTSMNDNAMEERGEYEDGLREGMWAARISETQFLYQGFYTKGKRNGSWMEFDCQSKSEMRGNYVDDLRDGAWTGSIAGLVVETGLFEKGLRCGRWVCTSLITGRRLLEKDFVEGLQTGIMRRYSEVTGRLIAEVEMLKGKFHGIGMTWNEEGQLMGQEKFKDDKRNGLSRYYSHGVLESIVTYENDVNHGLAETYDEDGRLESTGLYKEGKMHGLWKFYEDGVLYMEGSYHEGVQRGVWVKRHPNGTVRTIVRVDDDGKREGPVKKWHPNGKVHVEGQYVNDLRQGTFTIYDSRGRIRASGQYENDQRHGPWVIYMYVDVNDKPTTTTVVYDRGGLPQRTEYPCLIYKDEIPVGERYVRCSVNREHVYGLSAMVEFAGAAKMNSTDPLHCFLCQKPVEPEFYWQIPNASTSEEPETPLHKRRKVSR